MGRESAFVTGIEKQAEKWWDIFKKPFQAYASAKSSPMFKVKKALGLATLGTGASIYGINKIISTPDDKMTSRAPGVPNE